MRPVSAALLLACTVAASAAADEPAVTRTPDVIYGRKFGTALTMDVFTPKNANGAAIIWVVSGGWFSSHDTLNRNQGFIAEFLKRGYTVFGVVHGSQPKFTVPEIIDDLHRAVRYIRHHAKDYKIDPDRLGITGASAGGHLSLLIGTAGAPGDPMARDPVDRDSSRVRAVACFFPPADFLNWGIKGNMLRSQTMQPTFRAALDFREFDNGKRLFVPVTDDDKVRELTRKISPITHVSADDPPTLIIHGDKDTLVPIQQAELILARFKEAGVPAELVVKQGMGHGWPTLLGDMATLADWFDKHLTKSKKTE
jgi:acetyl esterase/lipase